MPQTGDAGGGWLVITYKYHQDWSKFNRREVAR
jgi:hypothetical protein